MSMSANAVSSGPMHLTWDPDVRLAAIRFDPGTNATGPDAAALVEAFSGWVGSEATAFALLGDAAGLQSMDAAYRSHWAKFFRQHRQVAVIAVFNLSPLIRIAAEMFGRGTGLRLRGFSKEAQARAWLRSTGIAA